MKETMWGYWIIVLGIFVIVVMMILQNLTTTGQQNYYILREVTDAAMHESIDWAHFRLTGGDGGTPELRINKEKFVENWLRRFAESINISRYYTVSFYDLFESPPKVSVRVATSTDNFGTMAGMDQFDVVDTLTSIMEFELPDVSGALCYFGANPSAYGTRPEVPNNN